MIRYIIGVDGGGTKTEAVAYDATDQELARGLAGFGNLALGFDQAVNHILSAIGRCREHVRQQGVNGECQAIYLGLAGMEISDNGEKARALLEKEFPCPIHILHDSALAHAAILKGQDGIVTIAGTGSVCYGVYQGRIAIAGGWGHLLGDEGGGYRIVMEALKRMTMEEDAGMPRSRLTKALMNHFGLAEVIEVKAYLYQASKAEVAAGVPMVVELARDSEENAIAVLKQAGKDLAAMTRRLCSKLGVHQPIDLGLSGSILTKVDLVRQEFVKSLGMDGQSFHVIIDDCSSCRGACHLHKKLWRDQPEE